MKATLLFAAAALAGMLALSASPPGRAERRAQPTIELKVSPLAFSPNADAFRDTLRATIRVDVPVTLTIEIVSDKGIVPFTDAPGVAVQPGLVRFSWNGKKAATGRVAKDGRHTLRATVVDSTGASAESEAHFLLDTHPPVMTWGEVSPTLLQQGPLYLRFRLIDLTARVQLKVALLDQGGTSVRTGAGSFKVPGRVELRWPRAHNPRLLPGSYKVSVKGTDEAGNSATSSTRTFLVDHAVRAKVYGLFRGVGRRIALTFDDCNFGGAWSSILHTLERYKVKGTFFCPGQQALANPELARRTVREGHAIGSHGWDHANFGVLSFGSAERRLDLDRQTWWKLARVAPTPYFRPPYGAYTATTMVAAGRAGYGAVVLWDVDPRDWSRPGAAAIENRVLTHVRPGSIVLMHVINQTAEALPAIVQRLLRRKFVPVTLTELDRIGTATSGHWPPYNSATSGA